MTDAWVRKLRGDVDKLVELVAGLHKIDRLHANAIDHLAERLERAEKHLVDAKYEIIQLKGGTY